MCWASHRYLCEQLDIFDSFKVSLHLARLLFGLAGIPSLFNCVAEACRVLKLTGLFVQVSRSNFIHFITEIENGYLLNSYHNALHAADVVANVFFMIQSSECCCRDHLCS